MTGLGSAGCATRPTLGLSMGAPSRLFVRNYWLASSVLNGGTLRSLAVAAGMMTVCGISPAFAQCYSTAAGLAGDCTAIVPTGASATAIGFNASANGFAATASGVTMGVISVGMITIILKWMSNASRIRSYFNVMARLDPAIHV